MTAVRLPHHPAIFQYSLDHAACRTSKRLHAVARLEVRARAHSLYDFDHGLPIQYTCDVVGNGGGDLTIAGGGKIAEQGASQFATDGGKGVAIEKEEGRLSVTALQEVEGVTEGDDSLALDFPLCCAR